MLLMALWIIWKSCFDALVREKYSRPAARYISCVLDDL